MYSTNDCPIRSMVVLNGIRTGAICRNTDSMDVCLYGTTVLSTIFRQTDYCQKKTSEITLSAACADVCIVPSSDWKSANIVRRYSVLPNVFFFS